MKLYRVTYASVVPERGNKPIVATGLIAIPDVAGTRFPMVSYQHGTVYGKQEVPSFPEQSSETQLMIAQFAGQGYVVIGADYFGMGSSTEPEGYMVKASVREMVLFAQHDVILDPPFTRLDILSCRNLLIYFNAALQRRDRGLAVAAVEIPGALPDHGDIAAAGAELFLFHDHLAR